MVTRTVRTLALASALLANSACGTDDADSAALILPAVAVPVESPSPAAAAGSTFERRASTAPVRVADVRSSTDVGGTVVIEPVVADEVADRIDPPEPAPAPEPEEVASEQVGEIEQVWLDLAECESNQRWDYNGSSGYDGGLQFLPATWIGVGGDDFAPYAWQATPFEQVTVAKRLLEVQGWGAWPACSRKLGLR